MGGVKTLPNRWLVESVHRRIQKRRTLVRTSRKESSKDEALKKASELRLHLRLGAPFAVSRVCDELASLALDPAPGAHRSRIAKKPLTTPTPLQMACGSYAL